MSAAISSKRRHGERGVTPLSSANRERLLKDLDTRAKGGDIAAAVGLLIVGTIADANRNHSHAK